MHYKGSVLGRHVAYKWFEAAVLSLCVTHRVCVCVGTVNSLR